MSNNHNHYRILILGVFILVLSLVVTGCAPSSAITGPESNNSQAQASNSGSNALVSNNGQVQESNPSSNYSGKKVLFVNSYHEGYPWSDGVEAGLHEVFDGTEVELKIIRLDTKNNPGESFGVSAGLAAKAEIDAFQPDVVIACDDNAQKYLVVPFLKNTELPVIFCGVNWDASAYGFPTSNVTGMIEVELPDQLIELLKAHAKGDRLGYITIDTETERKVVDIYNQRFFGGQLVPYWVTTQSEFMEAFVAAQKEIDILFMGNNAGSDTWDEEWMKQFILENTIIPTGSINDWMAPYSLLTLAKSAKEQGIWSAQTALRIFGGTSVSQITIAENKKGEMIVNIALADILDIVFAPSLLKNAIIIGE